ncbi:hypothetical protein [Fictibacillus arsenicus]|uniref:Uncharacterized protein n=1 Tax=Fictibacillus arsenicus TaxID=255247 RepID=A0A1V3G965_9BACL|nr:hypothetical protein [Fictibacillus arsenicus]OOE12817.1 hypothetical protein UN64_12250 [Fictibacillus arsenicus]
MSKKGKKRSEESPNGTGGKGGRCSESPNGKGASAAAGDGGKKLRKKLTDGASTPVAAAAANGAGIPSIEDAIREILARTAVERVEEAAEALRANKKTKKSCKKSCKKSKKCKENNTDSCWE